jgi:hypothetical protein
VAVDSDFFAYGRGGSSAGVTHPNAAGDAQAALATIQKAPSHPKPEVTQFEALLQVERLGFGRIDSFGLKMSGLRLNFSTDKMAQGRFPL